jgi:hypothetical protein
MKRGLLLSTAAAALVLVFAGAGCASPKIGNDVLAESSVAEQQFREAALQREAALDRQQRAWTAQQLRDSQQSNVQKGGKKQREACF